MLTLPALLSRARLFLLSLNLSLPARTLFQGMKSAMARDKAAKKAGTNKGSEQAVRLIPFPIAPRTTQGGWPRHETRRCPRFADFNPAHNWSPQANKAAQTIQCTVCKQTFQSVSRLPSCLCRMALFAGAA